MVKYTLLSELFTTRMALVPLESLRRSPHVLALPLGRDSIPTSCIPPPLFNIYTAVKLHQAENMSPSCNTYKIPSRILSDGISILGTRKSALRSQVHSENQTAPVHLDVQNA
jgi:hypothetical protein